MVPLRVLPGLGGLEFKFGFEEYGFEAIKGTMKVRGFRI